MSSPSEEGVPSGPFPGRYFDGRTAAAHEVLVYLEQSGLAIRPGGRAEGAASPPLAFWPYAALEIAAPQADRADMLLKCAGRDARLKLQGAKAVGAVTRHAPHLRRHPFARPHHWVRTAALVALPLLLAAALYAGIPAIARQAAAMLPAATRDALGRQAWDVVTHNGTRLCNDGSALRPLIARLTGDAQQAGKIKIGIVDMTQANAFALPGGRIIVYRGLIEKADDLGYYDGPAALAGVIAHEIGHIRALHPTAGLIRQIGLSSLFSLLFGSGTMIDIAGMMTNLSYSRDMEREADRTAIALLQRAGIATRPLAMLLKSIAAENGADGGAPLLEFLSTHPGTAERAAMVAAAGNASSSANALKIDWAAIKADCYG